jgi:hypothetical protein
MAADAPPFAPGTESLMYRIKIHNMILKQDLEPLRFSVKRAIQKFKKPRSHAYNNPSDSR